MALCEECDNTATDRCAGCHESRYCSKACQKKGWSTHKILCKTFQDFEERPTSEKSYERFTRAIYFHPDEVKPRFVWLSNLSKGIYLDNPGEETSDMGYTVGISSVWVDPALGREFGHGTALQYRDNFLRDGSTRNKAIHKIEDMRSRYLHDWMGPVIAYGARPFRDPSSYIVDLTPADLGHLAHWLNTYYFLKFNSDATELDLKHEHDTILGDRLNCDGDVKIDQRPNCEAFTIPGYHVIFEDKPTPISSHIGLPILVQRIAGSVKGWRERRGLDSFIPWVNQAATFLQLGCDPNKKDEIDGPSWGWAPMEWQNNVGAVMMMRQDKKPLHPDHAAALAEFCQDYLQPYFQETSRRESRMDKFSFRSRRRSSESTGLIGRSATIALRFLLTMFKNYPRRGGKICLGFIFPSVASCPSMFFSWAYYAVGKVRAFA